MLALAQQSRRAVVVRLRYFTENLEEGRYDSHEEEVEVETSASLANNAEISELEASLARVVAYEARTTPDHIYGLLICAIM